MREPLTGFRSRGPHDVTIAYKEATNLAYDEHRYWYRCSCRSSGVSHTVREDAVEDGEAHQEVARDYRNAVITIFDILRGFALDVDDENQSVHVGSVELMIR